MKLVIEEAALAAEEMSVEIVRLQTIERGGAFADTPVPDEALLSLFEAARWAASGS